MKTAIITGITSDMAQALQQKLQVDSWRVIGVSRAEVDLADLEAVIQYAQKLADEAETIDALVHFAGVWHDGDRALADMKFEDFTAQEVTGSINVGLTSFMVLTRAMLPKISPRAAVIGISGTFSSGGKGWVPYFVSKRGLEDFLIALAQDYPEKLCVYGISPADTATAPYDKFYPEYAASAQSPSIVAELAFELISGRTSHTSGDIIELRAGNQAEGYHI